MEARITLNEAVRESIAVSLIRLMKKAPLAQIPITEIVKVAGVGRSSFYRNFESKEQVLSSYLNSLYSAFLSPGNIPCRFSCRQDFEDFLLPRFRFIKQNREFFTSLRNNDLLYYAFDHLDTELMLRINGVESPVHDYLLSMLTGSCAGITQRWIDRGFQESEEEMADIFSPVLAGSLAPGKAHKASGSEGIYRLG